MNIDEQELITSIAKNIAQKWFAVFRKLRGENNIPQSIVCQIFLPHVKEEMIKTQTKYLGMICGVEEVLDTDLKNLLFVTPTENCAGSELFLKPTDSSLIILQKIASAVILDRIIQLIDEGYPDFVTVLTRRLLVTDKDVKALLPNKSVCDVAGW